MPVYMVYVCHSVSDRVQLERYWASIVFDEDDDVVKGWDTTTTTWSTITVA